MPHSNNLCYAFGPFTFNPDLRLLKRDQEVLALGEKAADVLLFLLRNAGELVGKEELMKGVWPDSFVEENNLTQNIFTLRRALGDDPASARYIETVPRRGYRFVAEVRKEFGSSSGSTSGDVQNTEGRTELPPILGVLPLINATGSDGLEYLAEGISDNIINNLSRISKLRVMSRSSMFRYKGRQLEAKKIAAELNVDAILVGKIGSRPKGMTISVELVDNSGVALWGDSFDCEMKDILEIQDEIARQISSALRLKLTGEEEKRITTRYTESSDAYQAYMEGRFHWSRYTRSEIEEAIEHFREAIELDPNYALAYSGIVDCYLRLATNYLPPENYLRSTTAGELTNSVLRDGGSSELSQEVSKSKIKLRHEWDWKAAEREIRRANELKADYPAAHQWHAAYQLARELSQKNESVETMAKERKEGQTRTKMPSHNARTKLTPSEQVQIFCTIAREQILVGNFHGASLILESWSPPSGWPRIDRLNSHIAADLLFTLGTLIGSLSSAGQLNRGEKRAEAFLNGSIALHEQLNSKVRAAESRIELARSYYRQGLFEEARDVLGTALADLPEEESELRSLCLVLFGAVERDSGRLEESLIRLKEASNLETTGQLVTGRCNHELAITFKELAISTKRSDYYNLASEHFRRALYECEAIGNHRHSAAVENNLGYLLLHLQLYTECEMHLMGSLELFESFSDRVRAAQVRETLTHLYLAVGKFTEAQVTINKAVETLELTDGEAMLAEALITKGVVACRQQRYGEARASFEGANRVAERCGDIEGVRRSLVTLYEEMGDRLDQDETIEVGRRLTQLLSNPCQTTLLMRTKEVLARITTIDQAQKRL